MTAVDREPVAQDFFYKHPSMRMRVSALTLEQSVFSNGRCPFLIQFSETEREYPADGSFLRIRIEELVGKWPVSVPERLDRALCNLARLSPNAGFPVDIRTDMPSLLFAMNEQEAFFHLQALQERGDLPQKHLSGPKLDIAVTAKGWSNFDRLTRGAGSRESDVFVAMWFGDDANKGGRPHNKTVAEMNAVYSSALSPGIRAAGYGEHRVDSAPHDDYIMNKVLGDIRLAPFVVADFTGNRGGVYFEAGFARGLGKPVIHTCHSEHFAEMHFDTKQLPFIRWATEAELEKQLSEWILGLVGPGPHYQPPPNA